MRMDRLKTLKRNINIFSFNRHYGKKEMRFEKRKEQNLYSNLQ